MCEGKINFKYYQENKRMEIAALYFNGVKEIENKNLEKAEVIFKKIIENADLGYTVLSYFKLANINFNKKDFQSMESNYDKIIGLKNINKAYKEFALILKITNSPNITKDKKIKIRFANLEDNSSLSKRSHILKPLLPTLSS